MPCSTRPRRRPRLALALAATAALPAAAADSDLDARAAHRAARRTPVVEVFEAAQPAVVNISSTEIVTVRRRGIDLLFEDMFDFPRRPRTRQFARQSVGSGFVVHRDGYIVTNAHVVARTAERKVTFADGREYDASIVAMDPERDLAILKIDAEGPLPTLPLGRSDDLMIGETVVAIGNPLGYANTVTAGVVSAVDRDLDVTRELTLRSLIQTDASINPGNSGGPLLNVLGELIGINSAIRTDAQNIGFAIPVDHLRDTMPDLLDVERRYRFSTGLAVSHLDPPRVLSVAEDSPADAAGLRPGDVIARIDDAPVRRGIDYDIGLIGRRPGETVRFEVERDGRRLAAPVRLEPRPAPDGARLARERLGIDVHPLPEDIARDLGLRGARGILVLEVEPGGPADALGLERHDVLVMLGRYAVGTIEELGQLLEAAEAGSVVEVTVLRVDRRGKANLSGRLEIR